MVSGPTGSSGNRNVSTHDPHKGVSQDGLHLDADLFSQLLSGLVGAQQGAQFTLFPAQRLVVREPVEGDPEGSLFRDGVETDGQGVTGDPLDLGRSVLGVLVLEVSSELVSHRSHLSISTEGGRSRRWDSRRRPRRLRTTLPSQSS